jgi:hypothetical protein
MPPNFCEPDADLKNLKPAFSAQNSQPQFVRVSRLKSTEELVAIFGQIRLWPIVPMTPVPSSTRGSTGVLGLTRKIFWFSYLRIAGRFENNNGSSVLFEIAKIEQMCYY